MTTKNTATIYMRLPASLKRRLRSIAQDQGVSMNTLLVEYMTALLSDPEGERK